MQIVSVVPLLACWIIAALMAGVLPAQAQPGTQWVTQQWKVEDGLPVNGITDARFGPGGFLYLTTFGGLVRFDGRDFVTYTASTHPTLPSNRFLSFVPSAPDELLFITEQYELVRMHEGEFTTYNIGPSLPGPLTRAFAYLPKSGTHYFGTWNGLVQLKEGEMTTPFSDVGNIRLFYKMGEDTVLFGTTDTLYRLEGERLVEVGSFPNELGTFTHMVQDEEGRFWTASPNAIMYANPRGVAAGAWNAVALPEQADGQLIVDMLRDAEGSVWFTTIDGGLYRQEGVTFRRASAEEWPGQPAVLGSCASPPVPVRQLPDGPVEGFATCYDAAFAPLLWFLQSEKGALWTVTDGQGLIRVTQSPITVLEPQKDISTRSAYALIKDAAERLWIGSFEPGLECAGTACPPIPAPFQDGTLSFHVDRNGQLLGGGYARIWRFDGRDFESIPQPYEEIGYVRALDTDEQGRLWVGAEVGLLVGQQKGNAWSFTHYLDELTHRWVRVIKTTRDGTRWLGTNGGGLMRVAEGSDGNMRFEPFTTEQGLCSDNVRDLYEDAEGILWVATEDRGLCRVDLRGTGGDFGRADIVNIRRANGLFDDGIHNILEDDDGRFWMATNQGLFWTRRADLETFAAGHTSNVFVSAYTERDGLLNREFNGGVQPSAWKDEDGILWFASQQGVVHVDPRAVVQPHQPEARIQAVYVKGEARPSDALLLEPDERDLTVEFTSVYFGNPEEVSFRYRLVGYDADWQLARAVRVAAYTNLAPGTYRFEVQAGLGDAWSDSAVLPFRRMPFFYETPLFVALGVLLVFGLIGLGMWWRLRLVSRRARQLERAVEQATADLQDANERLRAAHAVKDQFLANISHEFRTPLTLTYGPLNDLLNGRYAVDEEARPLLEQARRNGLRLHRLINQLLDLSRLDHGSTVLDRQEHDLAAFLRHRVSAFEALAREYGLDLKLHLPDEPVPFHFDAARLETVVLNLLSNAFKFTPGGGEVHVGLRQNAARDAVITMRDTGEGIAAEHLPHLFDRFYQVDGSTTRRREGTGIGLALAQQLVALHGGTIGVESAPGEGTTFTVTLPATKVPSDGGASAGEAPPDLAFDVAEIGMALPERDVPASYDEVTAPGDESDKAAPVVLVVEDNADMRAYIRSHLQDQAIIEEAENGAVGVERARELVPDLVVSDVMMPVQDGYDLLAALKADPRTSHVPVVLLTARADAQSRLAGLEGGADDYLAKPFDGNELRARVRNLIEGRRALRALWSRSAFTLSADAVEMPSAEAAFLEQVKAVIEARMRDVDFGPYELADEVAMSPRQLRRKLGSLIDETPNQLIRRFRLERAAALLAQGAGSVKAVAAAVGFGSTDRFSAAFHEHYGVPPSRYPAEANPS